AVSVTGYISLTQAGTNTGWFDPTRGFVTIGVSSTGPISGTAGYFSGNVGIGTTSPAAVLDVTNLGTTGTVRIGRSSSQYIQLWGNSGADYITNSGAKPLQIYTNGATALQLGANSNPSLIYL